ncbi:MULTISPECIES: nitroreductase/quinone reductase family protein [unclassified Actinotalea]|uniref:nitroreductase/quinone reductase family protein n=1 Tax=unclassified Actinotalea TaxID=2638618 RepID=UPI0021068814|nr:MULTISPECIES: nitroreductase/quinone reductase family protein [unclassified Actinotalea]
MRGILPGDVTRWMYRSGRPNWLARPMNTLAAWQYRHGVLTFGGRGVTLDVRGRTSGRVVSLPLVLVRHEGERYLVSMLGPDVQWLRNVRADGGRAVLHAPRPEPVLLTEVPAEDRAPILRRYVELAPGGRPHIPVPVGAPVEHFAAVAERHPVLRVDRRQAP